MLVISLVSIRKWVKDYNGQALSIRAGSLLPLDQ